MLPRQAVSEMCVRCGGHVERPDVLCVRCQIRSDAWEAGHTVGLWKHEGYWELRCVTCAETASVDDAGNCVWDSLQELCLGEPA